MTYWDSFHSLFYHKKGYCYSWVSLWDDYTVLPFLCFVWLFKSNSVKDIPRLYQVWKVKDDISSPQSFKNGKYIKIEQKEMKRIKIHFSVISTSITTFQGHVFPVEIPRFSCIWNTKLSHKTCLFAGLVRCCCFPWKLVLFKTLVICIWKYLTAIILLFFLPHTGVGDMVDSHSIPLRNRQPGVKNRRPSCTPTSLYCSSLMSRILPKPPPEKRVKRISFDSCYCHWETEDSAYGTFVVKRKDRCKASTSLSLR